MQRLFRAFWVSLSLFIACAHPPGVSVDLPSSSVRQSWDEVLRLHTRHVEFVHRLDTQLIASATLLTETVQKSSGYELVDVFHWDDDALEAYREDSASLFGKGTRILVHAASRSPELARLEPERQVWSITLLDAQGHAARPESVRFIKKPSSILNHLFPYVTDFGRTYLLSFPDAPESGAAFLSGTSVTLRLANTAGTVSLTWALPVR